MIIFSQRHTEAPAGRSDEGLACFSTLHISERNIFHIILKKFEELSLKPLGFVLYCIAYCLFSQHVVSMLYFSHIPNRFSDLISKFFPGRQITVRIHKKTYLLVLGGSKVIYRMFLVTILLDHIVNVKYFDRFIACQSKWIMLNSKLKKMHNQSGISRFSSTSLMKHTSH